MKYQLFISLYHRYFRDKTAENDLKWFFDKYANKTIMATEIPQLWARYKTYQEKTKDPKFKTIIVGEYLCFLTYCDVTHFFLSHDFDVKGWPYHIGQISGEKCYSEVQDWLDSVNNLKSGVQNPL